MPMFDDPKQELRRLQEQLLAEEEPCQEEFFDEDEWLDREIAEAKALSGYREPQQPPVRNYANGYGAQAPGTQTQRSYLSGYSSYQQQRPAYQPGTQPTREEVLPEEPAEDLRGLIALACTLTAGIVAVAMYWVFVLL